MLSAVVLRQNFMIRKITDDTELIVKSFPQELKNSVISLLEKLNLETECQTVCSEVAVLRNETIIFPYRVYYKIPNINFVYKEEKNLFLKSQKDPIEADILNCIFSRHDNGFVRQEAIKNLTLSTNYWVAPYLVRIMGEYIIQILSDLNDAFDFMDREKLKQFIQQNPVFYAKTQARISSYWFCYYRTKFPEKLNGIRVIENKRYVGFQLLTKIDKLLKT